VVMVEVDGWELRNGMLEGEGMEAYGDLHVLRFA